MSSGPPLNTNGQVTGRPSGIGKKRVRFNDEAEVVVFSTSDCLCKKLKRVPGTISTHDVEDLENFHISDDGEDACEDPATDWDIEQSAEAGYEDPEESFNEAGIPIEPFHLRRERERGYFDPESGSYVEYERREEVEDAWVDGLPKIHVENKHSTPKARAKASTVERGQHSARQLEMYKTGILGLLEPGENVLAALRRLGRSQQYVSSQTKPNASISSAGQQRGSGAVKRSSMEPSAKAAFDSLTEWSNALMESGDYQIHNMPRELLSISISKRSTGNPGDGSIPEGHYVGSRQPPHPETTHAAHHAAMDAEIDMFEEDDEGGDTDTEVGDAEQPRPSSGVFPINDAARPRDGEFGGFKVDVARNNNAEALAGFYLDAASGYLYNSNLGAYFDPATSLFGDANSGRWYKLNAENGQYIMV